MWKQESERTGYVNRPEHFTRGKRRAEKLVGSKTWFNKKRKNEGEDEDGKERKRKRMSPPKHNESVLFIPHTEDSVLKKKLQSLEDSLQGRRIYGRIKMVERVGPQIGSMLRNNTPWVKDSCGRQNCAPCKNQPGTCRANNCTYRISCTLCLSLGRQSHYIGETARSWTDRSLEHQEALRTKNQKFAPVQH